MYNNVFYLTNEVIDCRDKVRMSIVDNHCIKENDTVIGHVYNKNGKYHTYYMKYTKENLAKFICSSNKDKLVCDSNDYAIFNTIGKYLDLCNDKELNAEILPVLLKFQNTAKDQKFEYER